jgi:hypothetical protein
MKLLLRGLFVCMLVVALMAQASRLSSRDVERDDKARLTEALTRLGLQVSAADGSAILTVVAPGCPEPLFVTAAGFDGEGDGTLRTLLVTDGVPRYVYLGYVGSSAAPVAMGSRWAAASALAVFGLRQTSIPSEVIVAILPKACPHLTHLDWSVLSPWP